MGMETGMGTNLRARIAATYLGVIECICARQVLRLGNVAALSTFASTHLSFVDWKIRERFVNFEKRFRRTNARPIGTSRIILE